MDTTAAQPCAIAARNRRLDQRPSLVPALGFALAGLAFCLLVSACANPPGTPRARAGRCQVGIVGDSLLVGARDTGGLKAKLYDNVCSITEIDAEVGRPSSDGASVVESWARADHLPSILVIELGTNDCSASAFQASARRILKAAGPDRPVVWIKTWRRGCDAAINGVLDRFVRDGRTRADGGRIWLVDHYGWIKANPENLAGDGIHLTSSGYGRLAQRLVNALGIRHR